MGLVIQYINKLGSNEGLSLKQLTLKTVMLLALTRPSRSADLSKLDIQTRSFKSNGVVFRPLHLAKQSKASDVVNFLAGLFSEGYQYQSLNAYRSAISSTHDNVDGVSVGSHPAVTRLLKGAFHS